MSANLPLWVEGPVVLLLVLSGVFSLVAGVGIVRFKTFFMRMHPPALAFTFAAWCVTLASILYFSHQNQTLSLRAWLIIIFLSLTVPVTTSLLARTELFRRRTNPQTAHEVPPPLSHMLTPAQAADSDRAEVHERSG